MNNCTQQKIRKHDAAMLSGDKILPGNVKNIVSKLLHLITG